MREKGFVVGGSIIIVLLLVAIVGVFLWQRSMVTNKSFKNLQVDKVKLNIDFTDPSLYTEISLDDINSGRLVRSEMVEAKPFPEDTIPFKFNQENVGIDTVKLLWDEGVYGQIKENPHKAPFRNLYFYKMAYGDKWLTIMGQQVRNSNGSTGFMHYLLGVDNQVRVLQTNAFGMTPVLRPHYKFYGDIGIPSSFFRVYGDYQNREGIVEEWMMSWNKSGIVPQELQREILLMQWKE